MTTTDMAEHETPTLISQITDLASRDRTTTLHNVFAALEQIEAMGAISATIEFDPRMIGAQREAKSKLIGALVDALIAACVIEFAEARTPNGAMMQGTLMVLRPVNGGTNA